MAAAELPDPAPASEGRPAGGAAETRTATLAKAALALALFAVAGWLVASRWERARIHWHLGTLRQDPADRGARDVLRALGDRALPYLEEELALPDANARLVAVLALAAIDGPGARDLLAKATRDADGLTAANATAALAQRPGEEARAAILAGLADSRAPVRWAARRALSARTRLPWWSFGRPSA